jgi:hypothetical protein
MRFAVVAAEQSDTMNWDIHSWGGPFNKGAGPCGCANKEPESIWCNKSKSLFMEGLLVLWDFLAHGYPHGHNSTRETETLPALEILMGRLIVSLMPRPVSLEENRKLKRLRPSSNPVPPLEARAGPGVPLPGPGMGLVVCFLSCAIEAVLHIAGVPAEIPETTPL